MSSLRNYLSKSDVTLERKVPPPEEFLFCTTYRLTIPADVGKRLADAVHSAVFEVPEFHVVTPQFAVSYFNGRQVWPSAWSEKTDTDNFTYFDVADVGISVCWSTSEPTSFVEVRLPERTDVLDHTKFEPDESDWVEVKGLLEYVFGALD
jgi:hypothetical protein